MTPDFSPSMLKTFLRIRIAMEARISFPSPVASAEKAAYTMLRKQSGLTRAEFDLAYEGRLRAGRGRAMIWAALWVDPAEFRILLRDDGSQEVVDAT